MPTLNVHLLTEFDEQVVTDLRTALDANVNLTAGDISTINASYHILIAGVLERKHLTASDRLHTLIIPWAGLPVKTRELMQEFPHIAVHNLHHNAAPAAEMAITLMLAAAKRIVPIDRALRKGDWTPRYEDQSSPLLDGKTALILGYGAIGKRIAATCRALGMNVLATKREVENEADFVRPAESLLELLPQCHLLFVCLPFTPDTEGSIDAEALATLPDGATIVNVARGPIIDETALYEELRSGRIQAGLDVWYEYPKEVENRPKTQPSKYPFHELDNVAMTPHLGGHSDDTERRRIEGLAELLNAAARGESLPNRVDIELGY